MSSLLWCGLTFISLGMPEGESAIECWLGGTCSFAVHPPMHWL